MFCKLWRLSYGSCFFANFKGHNLGNVKLKSASHQSNYFANTDNFQCSKTSECYEFTEEKNENNTILTIGEKIDKEWMKNLMFEHLVKSYIKKKSRLTKNSVLVFTHQGKVYHYNGKKLKNPLEISDMPRSKEEEDDDDSRPRQYHATHKLPSNVPFMQKILKKVYFEKMKLNKKS